MRTACDPMGAIGLRGWALEVAVATRRRALLLLRQLARPATHHVERNGARASDRSLDQEALRIGGRTPASTREHRLHEVDLEQRPRRARLEAGSRTDRDRVDAAIGAPVEQLSPILAPER